MVSERVERRLAAILAADVVGYTRLMEADEPGTLEQLKRLREGVIAPEVARHRGRIFKTSGDGVLAEFRSASDAVQCAVSIQRQAASEAPSSEAQQSMLLRIGISLGDVMVDGDDLYGNGVNVAARLEALAEPGTICVSGNVQEHVAGADDLEIEPLGEQTVKNIAHPIRTFRVRAAEGGAVASAAAIAEGAAPRLPSKPSIAVLPFENMSGDREQEYFVDGISEDIITALSRTRWLFVIARNSSFIYKGRAVDVKQVARDLGVRYVLEGSVRKIGNHVRITAQLVDTLTGAHHWAERYDRELTDIFALQDEITRNVAAAIEPQLLAAEGIRSSSRLPADLDSWDRVARAMHRFWRLNAGDIDVAISILKEAVRRYPDYAPAHSMLAFGLVLAGHFALLPMFEIPALAIESAHRAAELDDNDPWAYLALGYVAFVERDTDRSVAYFRQAIDLNPNFAAAHGFLGYPLAFSGRGDEAIVTLSLAMRMSPHDRQNAFFMAGMAVAHYLAGRYEEAIHWGRTGVQKSPGAIGAYRILTAALAMAGRTAEAQTALEQMRKVQPGVSLDWVRQMVPYTPDQMPKFLEGLRRAGLS